MWENILFGLCTEKSQHFQPMGSKTKTLLIKLMINQNVSCVHDIEFKKNNLQNVIIFTQKCSISVYTSVSPEVHAEILHSLSIYLCFLFAYPLCHSLLCSKDQQSPLYPLIKVLRICSLHSLLQVLSKFVSQHTTFIICVWWEGGRESKTQRDFPERERKTVRQSEVNHLSSRKEGRG